MKSGGRLAALPLVAALAAAAIVAEKLLGQQPSPETEASPGVEWHLLVVTSFQHNFNQPASGMSAFRVFDTRAGHPRVNLVALSLAKQPAPFGFQLDLVSGRDVAVFASLGDWKPKVADFKQAFVSWKPGWGGLEIRAGKFVTTAGYEVIQAWENLNPNFSNSFLFGYAIPFSHTGLRLSLPVSSWLTLLAGANRGWDKWEDNNGALSYEFAATLTPADWLTLVLDTHHGPEQARDRRDLRHLYDLALTAKPTGSATLGLNADYGTEAAASTLQPGARAEWLGGAAYGSYALHPRWTVSLRLEEFADRQGARTGVAQTLRDANLTLDWSVLPSVVLRADARADRSSAPVFEGSSPDSAPYRRSQATLALSVVVKR